MGKIKRGGGAEIFLGFYRPPVLRGCCVGDRRSRCIPRQAVKVSVPAAVFVFCIPCSGFLFAVYGMECGAFTRRVLDVGLKVRRHRLRKRLSCRIWSGPSSAPGNPGSLYLLTQIGYKIINVYVKRFYLYSKMRKI